MLESGRFLSSSRSRFPDVLLEHCPAPSPAGALSWGAVPWPCPYPPCRPSRAGARLLTADLLQQLRCFCSIKALLLFQVPVKRSVKQNPRPSPGQGWEDKNSRVSTDDEQSLPCRAFSRRAVSQRTPPSYPSPGRASARSTREQRLRDHRAHGWATCKSDCGFRQRWDSAVYFHSRVYWFYEPRNEIKPVNLLTGSCGLFPSFPRAHPPPCPVFGTARWRRAARPHKGHYTISIVQQE